MTGKTIADFAAEDHQHGAIRRLTYRFEMERRDFFKLLGGGVLICLCANPALAQESGARHSDSEQLPNTIAGWLHIDEAGRTTVYTGKVEMGQNIRTSLTQQVAEELRVPLSSIELVMGDTDLTPFDMGTFGSRTTPIMGRQLRSVAATAREVLIEMAAERWHVNGKTLVAEEGRITDTRSQQAVSYADLTKGQQLVKVIGEDPPMILPKDWSIAGEPVEKIDGRAFVTSKHKYTSDLTRPGMRFGKVLRPTGFHATLASFDSSDAEKVPGIQVVRDGDFAGVVAPDEQTAARAVEALRAQWNSPSQPSETELFEYLRKNASSKSREADNRHGVGSPDQGFAHADKTLTQTYTVAYIAHVPLEPRAALAEWSNGKLTVWTGTQRPFAVREELAQNFHIPKEQVHVIVPGTGSAYGGKHTGDAALEAARLAKAAGKPVKVVWTREEEFTWAYFRPAGVIDVKSGARADGGIVAWEFDNYNSGPAAMDTPYNIANWRAEFHPVDSPLRQGSYRGLAATANHFARETHMDELAHLVGMDALEFRLKNLTNPRLRAVFEAAARRFGWRSGGRSKTRGLGIAGGIEKGGHVATCAEVEIDPGSGAVKIRRVVEAFECGAIVNPGGLQNQIEGSIVQAIGGALFEAIHFDQGRILNPHLAQYRVPRFSDLPKIEVEMLDRKDLPAAGAGETPIVGLAPAVGNAIFNATGIRLRSLPLVPEGLPQPQKASAT